METQTRLLRVLQEGEYTTIGGRQPIKTDVRVIAATHQDLRRLIRQGLFREDLYFRLNVVPLRLPPLRERLEDIEELVRHFMARGADEGLSVKSFDREAIDALKAHGWPGNVRELENLVRRLSALHADELLVRSCAAGVERHYLAAPQTQQAGNNLTESLHFHLSNYFKGHGNSLPPNGLYERVMREVETPLIELCLEATRGNQIKAAELLGVNRNTLRKKIRDLNIEVVQQQEINGLAHMTCAVKLSADFEVSSWVKVRLRALKSLKWQVLARGRFCAMLLSDMGADIIRIDRKVGQAAIRLTQIAEAASRLRWI